MHEVEASNEIGMQTPALARKRVPILSLDPIELQEWVCSQGEKAYRAGQVLQWVYCRGAASFSEMTNVPRALREALEARFRVRTMNVAHKARSAKGDASKFLLELLDGECIETVSMLERGRRTFCISTQVGCAMRCLFCATGTAGFKRNLTASEIVEQVLILAGIAGHPTNIVFMGMGEPLLNIKAVMQAIRTLTDPHRFGLSPRRITVSTCGVPRGIKGLAESGLRVNLALSLNSPFDKQRSKIMPINRRYPLESVLRACEYYRDRTGRRATVEYVLLHRVNTSPRAAAALGGIAERIGAHVNLIAFNPVEGARFKPPTRDEMAAFRDALLKRGVAATIRYRRGRDIQAACGQLRGKHSAKATN